jgi:CelD/BcsL family acetyltransferase involved in cellulose biosynthesis
VELVVGSKVNGLGPQVPREIHLLDPLTDPRWSEFLERHPASSVFHSRAWLEALKRTYNHEPVAFTTCWPNAPLENAVVFCRVKSWLTGKRLVSLPFSDHTAILAESKERAGQLVSAVERAAAGEKLRYIEIRPTEGFDKAPVEGSSSFDFCRHEIDLTPGLETLLKNCHKDSVQRKIQRAEREGLRYEEGRSAALLESFYKLMVLTRRRHLVPPQSKAWFQNLIRSFGEGLKIRVAFQGSRAVASILTLVHKNTLTYKYGGSDRDFHNTGAMHLLFWRSIEEAKKNRLSVFDLGRSDRDNPGLITFKDRWGTRRLPLSYLRFHCAQPSTSARSRNLESVKKLLLPYVPDPILRSVGGILYKHVG